MEDYVITEEDIQKVIHHLGLTDPKNADRDYAIQLLESMQGVAQDLVRPDQIPKEVIEEIVSPKNKTEN